MLRRENVASSFKGQDAAAGLAAGLSCYALFVDVAFPHKSGQADVVGSGLWFN
jgi:hypothetical protein